MLVIVQPLSAMLGPKLLDIESIVHAMNLGNPPGPTPRPPFELMDPKHQELLLPTQRVSCNANTLSLLDSFGVNLVYKKGKNPKRVWRRPANRTGEPPAPPPPPGWPVGRLAGWPVGRLAGWPVRFAGWPVGRLAGWPVGRLAGSAARLPG